MSDNEPQPSPSGHDDVAVAVGGLAGNGNNGTVPPGSAGSEANRGVKRPRPSAADDDDDDDDGKPGRERRKIEIKFIQDKSRRHITFSKRKAGIMKKAYELSVLTGTQVLLLVVSETGLVYTFTTPKLQPLVTKAEGKNLIQACLNAPEPATGNENGVGDGESAVDSPEEPTHPQLPPQAGAIPRNPQMHTGVPVSSQYMTAEQQQAVAYQNYISQQQAAQRGHYMPAQPGMQQSHPTQS
ncbi:MAG: transcription factor of the MADS box [Geoglossum umbratile]|nr:MAG: transcription factor of the MADS box [Geoglossum umbratile]